MHERVKFALRGCCNISITYQYNVLLLFLNQTQKKTETEMDSKEFPQKTFSIV